MLIDCRSKQTLEKLTRITAAYHIKHRSDTDQSTMCHNNDKRQSRKIDNQLICSEAHTDCARYIHIHRRERVNTETR